jgi:hypothetical protein
MDDLPQFKSSRPTKTANRNGQPKCVPKPSTKVEPESDELAEILADDAPDEIGGGGHLDGFRAADLDLIASVQDAVREVDEDGNEIDEGDDEPAEPDEMTKEAFYGMIEMGFAVPAMIEPVFAPVAIQDEEAAQARLATDAGFDLIKMKYPHLLKERGFDTMGKIALVGMFLMAKVKVTTMCFNELKRRDMEARRAAQQPQQQPQQAHSGEQPAANDDAPPKAGGKPSRLDWMDAEGAVA